MKAIGERGAEQTLKTWISFCFPLAFSVVYAIICFAYWLSGAMHRFNKKGFSGTEATLHYAIMYFSHWCPGAMHRSGKKGFSVYWSHTVPCHHVLLSLVFRGHASTGKKGFSVYWNHTVSCPLSYRRFHCAVVFRVQTAESADPRGLQPGPSVYIPMIPTTRRTNPWLRLPTESIGIKPLRRTWSVLTNMRKQQDRELVAAT